MLPQNSQKIYFFFCTKMSLNINRKLRLPASAFDHLIAAPTDENISPTNPYYTSPTKDTKSELPVNSPIWTGDQRRQRAALATKITFFADNEAEIIDQGKYLNVFFLLFILRKPEKKLFYWLGGGKRPATKTKVFFRVIFFFVCHL